MRSGFSFISSQDNPYLSWLDPSSPLLSVMASESMDDGTKFSIQLCKIFFIYVGGYSRILINFVFCSLDFL